MFGFLLKAPTFLEFVVFRLFRDVKQISIVQIHWILIELIHFEFDMDAACCTYVKEYQEISFKFFNIQSEYSFWHAQFVACAMA